MHERDTKNTRCVVTLFFVLRVSPNCVCFFNRVKAARKWASSLSIFHVTSNGPLFFVSLVKSNSKLCIPVKKRKKLRIYRDRTHYSTSRQRIWVSLLDFERLNSGCWITISKLLGAQILFIPWEGQTAAKFLFKTLTQSVNYYPNQDFNSSRVTLQY